MIERIAELRAEAAAAIAAAPHQRALEELRVAISGARPSCRSCCAASPRSARRARAVGRRRTRRARRSRR